MFRKMSNRINKPKMSSYRKNYTKIQGGKNDGKYERLDFAYLKELSTIGFIRWIRCSMLKWLTFFELAHIITSQLKNRMIFVQGDVEAASYFFYFFKFFLSRG